MSKQSVNEDIKKLYIFNESLNEEDVAIQHTELHKKAVEDYGDWEKALRMNGITKKKIKERERFMLYALMKNRYTNFGPESLRPKNIDKDTKDRIIESYKTLKHLKDIIINWSEEKVLFELRIQLLGGASLDAMSKDNLVLYDRLMEYYGDMQKVIEVYNNHFGSPTIQSKHNKDRQKTKDAQPHSMDSLELEKLAETMAKMNYIDKPEDLFNIQEAQQVKKREVHQFVSQLLAHAQLNNETLSMSMVYEKNPIMFFAIKMHYGDLNTAINEMAKAVVVNG